MTTEMSDVLSAYGDGFMARLPEAEILSAYDKAMEWLAEAPRDWAVDDGTGNAPTAPMLATLRAEIAAQPTASAKLEAYEKAMGVLAGWLKSTSEEAADTVYLLASEKFDALASEHSADAFTGLLVWNALAQ